MGARAAISARQRITTGPVRDNARDPLAAPMIQAATALMIALVGKANAARDASA